MLFRSFLAMHWGRRSLSHDGVNALTLASYDPISKQPELKHAALRIAPAELPWRLLMLRSADSTPQAQEQVLQWRARLEPLLAGFDYASLTLDGRERPLIALRLACVIPLPAGRIEALAHALDLPADTCLNYQDPARNIVKRACVQEGRLTGMLLAGEDAAGGWLRTAVRDGLPIEELRRWIFAPRAAPPIAAAAPRHIICNCLDVPEDAIRREIAAGADLPALQEKLKCGTTCGSCVPELKRLLVRP